ncbi:unnamed protein product [Polarella glacialis]|uniref:Uncharacterized protein n=1 Tax=Polarella glacialis TaxID=89957 RepID=A0A813DI40_POLGL|nr:unnamed protein product [Polarella glacialis]CAE8634043.1 unnamed protein product [Polarella glacialis]CAE8735556.1 unnamed protein product [Polarella glacialis]
MAKANRARPRAAPAKAVTGPKVRLLHSSAALVACLVTTSFLGRQLMAFISAPSPSISPAARLHAPGSNQLEEHGRRRALTSLVGALGLSLGLAPGPEQSAWALRDARYDSICSYKCMDVCNEKAPNNTDYCQKTCDQYCAKSKQEQELKSGVKTDSGMSRILMNARKVKFDGGRADDRQVVKIDGVLGKAFVPNNETDFKNGIKESIRR